MITHITFDVLDPDQETQILLKVTMNSAEQLQAETLLRRAEFFAGLPAAGLRALSQVARLEDHTKGEVVFHEGQTGTSMYLVATGKVQLYRTTPDGRDVTIRVIGANEVFAEVILFESDEYPVTAECIADTRLIALPRTEIHRLLADPDFRAAFIGHLMTKMRYLTGRIRELTLHDVETRFFSFLDEHYGDTSEITLDISKKNLAAAISTTPESLSRLITRLTKDGTIEWHGKVLRRLT
jgi:CRP-like cAMP-binding protein